MGMIYRVTVTAERTDGDYDTETLFELAGGAALIGRLAPSAVIEAVAQRTEDVRVDGAPLADRVMDAAATAGAPVHPFAAANEPVKRPRRTKVQIAADKAAQEAGFRDAAHQAEAAQVVAAGVAAAPGPEAYVPTEPTPAPNGAIVPEQATPPAVADGPPFNPFTVK
jgi:hypothetical protein